MHQTDKIEDLARELGIDSGTSESQADRLRKISEAIGMDHYNSLYDNDKLEEKLKDIKKQRYPNMPHYDATGNTQPINSQKNNNLLKNRNLNQPSRKNNKSFINRLKPKGLSALGGGIMHNSSSSMEEGQTSKQNGLFGNLGGGLGVGLGAGLFENQNDQRNEAQEQASIGDGQNLKVSFKFIKISLIASIPIFVVVIFINLFMSASQIYYKAIGFGDADKLSDSKESSKIDKKLEDAEDDDSDLDEEITDEDSDDVAILTLQEHYVVKFRNSKLRDSNIVTVANKYVNGKYNEADLETLEDFYPNLVGINGVEDESLIYDFFFKMYRLSNEYKTKYNVDLNLPLLMATLTMQSDDIGIVFSSNLEQLDRLAYKRPIPDEYDYYYDWSNYTPKFNDSTHDMEVLAQHMVSVMDASYCRPIELASDGKCYKFDDNKYREYLKEFIVKKYYVNNENISNNNNDKENNDNNTDNDNSNNDNNDDNDDEGGNEDSGTTTPATPASGYYKDWKQCGGTWSNMTVPSSKSTMCSIGCLITSVTMQIARSGTITVESPIDPGVALKYYKFVNGGNFVWRSTTNLAPNFEYYTAINLAGMNKESIAKKLSSYDASKYYIVLAVSKLDRNSVHHYVALDYISTNNDIYIMDPARVTDLNLYSNYKVYKAHIYVKKD